MSLIMDMDLKKLYIFKEVAENESFSRASEKLFMSQSTVSMHIKTLEGNLDLTLLKRGKNRTIPTIEGEMVLKYTKQIFALVNELESQLDQLKEGNTGVLRIEMASTVHSFILPNIIQRFCIQNPSIDVRIRTDRSPNIIEHVLDNSTDIGIVKSATESVWVESLGTVLLEKDCVVPICSVSNNLLEKKQVTLADLVAQEVLFYGRRTDFFEQMQNFFKKKGLKLRIQGSLDDLNTICTMIGLGKGICFLPSKVAQQALTDKRGTYSLEKSINSQLEGKRITTLSVPELQEVHRYTHLVYKKNLLHTSPLQNKLLTYIKDYNKELEPQKLV